MIAGLVLLGCGGNESAPRSQGDAAGGAMDVDTSSPSPSLDSSPDLPTSSPEVGKPEVLDATRDTTPEVAAGTCLRGATALECQRCGSASAACSQACPAVDCNVSPAPAECTTVCKTCCSCGLAYANTYFWTSSYSAIPCSTDCSDTYARWLALMAEPAMTACTGASDCTVVGGQPSMDPCNGGVAIGGCGVAANAAAYQASAAPALEAQYPVQCLAPKAYDCGPGHATCSQGKCVIQGWGCCFGCSLGGDPSTPVDAAIQDAPADKGTSPLDSGGLSLDSGRG